MELFSDCISFFQEYPYLAPFFAGAIITFWVFIWKGVRRRVRQKEAAKDISPLMSPLEAKKRRKLFIETRFQNISPTKEEEPGFTAKYVSKQKLIPFFIHTAFNENKESEKFYIVLADSGMGKTTFMVNLLARYYSFYNFGRKYEMKLFFFGRDDIIQQIKDIPKKEVKNTILLLDAFDEYRKLLPPDKPDGLTDDERFRRVLDEIIETVKDFRDVIITSRTQYFPNQEQQPYELKVKRFDDKGFHTLAKLYLSPFDQKEIQQYLKKKYSWFHFRNYPKRLKALDIINNSQKLMARPMLLAYIDYLLDDAKKTYHTTYEIYNTLIQKWIERESNKREHQQTKREKFKQNLHKYSQLIAVRIYQHRKENNTNTWQLNKADATDVNIELKDYQMTGQSLLTRDAANNWKFAHKSILEFFLAKEAKENLDFAWELDFTGLDMAEQFCKEIGLTAFLSSNYVLIKEGKFLMGSPKEEEGRTIEETLHFVKLSKFYMCKYAVTTGDFHHFVEKVNYQTNQKYELWKEKQSEVEYNHPVLYVSWQDAIEYCKWLSKKTGKKFRLPTEAEWEYACRAGTSTPFHTGENLTTEQANYNGNYPYAKNKKGVFRQNTVSVNSFEPNIWGLYNMHGNVWEWCMDNYSSSYYEQCKKQDLVENPVGDERGNSRVIRGGGWNTHGDICRSAFRNYDSPFFRDNNIGFRLVFVP